ncbi:exodeoxyribonuclease VII large subunit [Pseudomonas hunanensis]|nr:exodeoxyribonuclease VII large subunit [Pseudomonas hunanensis]
MIRDPFERLGLDREVLTVSQLNGRARVLLEDVFRSVWVEGEISNLARPASGHMYFTLKDSGAQIRCALFRQNAARVRQALRDGLAVRVRGKVSLFEGRGDYQLILDTVEPAGDGALRLAFEALKEKLGAEGLFSTERKKPLPAHPQRIGIITSPTGAVIRDIISVFGRRAPQVELNLIPTTVQGREAINQIVRALQMADRQGFDALILARGGGSLEDLWCFNEEAVARAVAACVTPIVSAVGHETDVSISDFVADVRAPTPSAAAELLAPDSSGLQQRLDGLQRRLLLRMQNRLAHDRLRLDGLARRLRHPGEAPAPAGPAPGRPGHAPASRLHARHEPAPATPRPPRHAPGRATSGTQPETAQAAPGQPRRAPAAGHARGAQGPPPALPGTTTDPAGGQPAGHPRPRLQHPPG